MTNEHSPTRRAAPTRGGLDAGAPTEGRPAASPSAEPPRTLGRHEVKGRLGAGGMGEVFAVHDPVLEREVAVKVVRGGLSPVAREKFVREALITGQLEHPGIVPLYDMGEGATPYFVMRKVAGTDLQAVLAQADPPGLVELLAIFVKVCEAVAFAHSKGIIHRDLKPANVMTGAFGEVYVMDWGLAKRVGDKDRARGGGAAPTEDGATLDGTVMGTPQYMPPEQADGEIARLDERSDVYSLGAILYHLLTGVPPYDGSTSLAILEKVTAGPPDPPSARVRGDREIPWELEAVCVKAMAHAQDARYSSASALKHDVESFLAGRFVGAARYGPWAAVRKWAARNKALVRGAVAVLAAGLAVAGVLDHRARAAARDLRARHVALVAAAQDRLRGTDLAGLVARARAVPLAPDPARRVLPGAAELARQAGVLTQLAQVSQALGDLLALEPEDDRVQAAQYEALCAIAHLAQVRHDDGMAALAYAQAARLGVDDPAALAGATAAAAAPAARLAARAARIEAILALAEEGRLDTEVAYQGAMVELASYRERQTVERLVLVVEDATARLRAAAHDVFARALPDELAAIAPVLAARIDPFAASPSVADLARLARATSRLIRHERRLFGEMSERRSGRQILEAGQAEALAEGGRHRAVAERIACDALGLIGDPEDVVAPLERLIWAHLDEREAVPAGIALVRLAARSPDARRAVLGVAGLVGDPAKQHVDVRGPFWVAVSKELAAAGIAVTVDDAQAEPSTALAFAQRGLARFYQGDHPGALADYDRALDLDGASAYARVNRGVLRLVQGDYEGALADLDVAIAAMPTLTDAHAQRGSALTSLGRREEAFAAYARALELDPDHVLTLASRAHTHLRTGDLAAALADVDRAIALDPRSITALIVRGRVRTARREHAGAIADFTRVLELDPRFVEAFLGRAFARHDQGDGAAAWADIARALAIAPDHAQGLFLRALVRRDRKELDLALTDVERSIARDGGDHRAHNLRAQLLCDLGRTDDGLLAFAQAIARWPDVARSHLDRGNVLLGQKRFSEAHADYDRALALEPDSAPALAGRSSARRFLGDLPGALVDLDRALALEPTNARLYSNRGVLHADRRDWARSLADYDRALELEPGEAKVLCLRGGVRRAAGDLAGALADYDRALELDPDEAKAHEGRGKVLQAQGEGARALEAFARALDLDANLPDVHVYRGQQRQQQGDVAGARADYDRAIELDPSFPAVWTLRGVLRQDAGDFAGAIVDHARYVELVPGDPMGHANLGSARWDAGDLAGAVSDFDRALAIDPEHAQALVNRGDVRALRGEVDLARADFERALRRVDSPKAWRAHLGLARLHAAAGRRTEAQAAVAKALATAPASHRAKVELEGKKLLSR